MALSAQSRSVVERLLLTLDLDVDAIAVCGVESGTRLHLEAMDRPMLHYVLSGEGQLFVNGSGTALGAGSFIVVPPHNDYRIEAGAAVTRERHGMAEAMVTGEGMLRLGGCRHDDEDALRTVCGAIAEPFEGSLGFFDGLNRPLGVGAEFTDRIRDIFGHLLHELATPRLGTRAIVNALLKQALVLLVRSELDCAGGGLGWFSRLQDRRLGAVVAAILDDPSADWSVEQLAETASMSRSALTRQFSDAFDVTPAEFITQVRLNQAARLLRQTRLPIQTIASSVGHSSRSHFSHAFRERYGCAPAEFRERHGVAPASAPPPMPAARTGVPSRPPG